MAIDQRAPRLVPYDRTTGQRGRILECLPSDGLVDYGVCVPRYASRQG